jgi:hypothetical protein
VRFDGNRNRNMSWAKIALSLNDKPADLWISTERSDLDLSGGDGSVRVDLVSRKIAE